MVATIITYLLSNVILSLLLLWAIVTFFVIKFKHPHSSSEEKWEVILRQFVFWNIGVSYIYNFVMHTVFAQMTASFIGWANSPFQYEVAFASLGFGINGLLATRLSLGFKAATIIGPAFFLWGAAGGHVYQMIQSHNFAPGNAGSIFWTDIFVPIIGFVLLWKRKMAETA